MQNLFSDGYCVTGGSVLLRHGRKCVAIRVLAKVLHGKVKESRRADIGIKPATCSIEWHEFTERLTGMIVRGGFATESMSSDYFASELGL